MEDYEALYGPSPGPSYESVLGKGLGYAWDSADGRYDVILWQNSQGQTTGESVGASGYNAIPAALLPKRSFITNPKNWLKVENIYAIHNQVQEIERRGIRLKGGYYLVVTYEMGRLSTAELTYPKAGADDQSKPVAVPAMPDRPFEPDPFRNAR